MRDDMACEWLVAETLSAVCFPADGAHGDLVVREQWLHFLDTTHTLGPTIAYH